MSLFGNSEYRWRETFLIMLDRTKRPSGAEFERAMGQLGGRYVVDELAVDDEGLLETATLLAPSDHAAMDVSFVAGEEVSEQVAELYAQLADDDLLPDEQQKLAQITSCDARLDLLHFEKIELEFLADDAEEEEMMDPGSLLIVAATIEALCQGVAVDPQSGTFI